MAMHSQPSISRRISLRFLPADPTEHTDTLVLTVPPAPSSVNTRTYYVDFRPLLSSPTEIEWAFGGYKLHLGAHKYTWIHMLDSRGDGREEADVGECEALPNGDELERGTMRDPATGVVGPYEEVWRDENIPADAQAEVAITPPTSLSESERIDGLFIRIGPYAQAVVRSQASGVCALRFRERDGTWTRTAAYGAEKEIAHIPIPREGRRAGEQFEIGGRAWEVVEQYALGG